MYVCVRTYPVSGEEGLEHEAEERRVFANGLLDEDGVVARQTQTSAVRQDAHRLVEILRHRNKGEGRSV